MRGPFWLRPPPSGTLKSLREPNSAGVHPKRILIVDDDRFLAETLRAMIEDYAHFDAKQVVAVEIANDGREGARRLESGDPFDAILCDVAMPGLDGFALFERLRARGSPLAERFVLVTGGAFRPAPIDLLDGQGPPCLRKPFDGKALGAVLGPLLV
jgi:two-component system NtrC family sensor kinase